MGRIMWVALATSAAVLVLLTASAADAFTTVKCFDGNAQAVVRVPAQPPHPVDWATCDTVVDGTCHFTIARLGCGCAPVGCCGFDEVAVKVRRQRTVRGAFHWTVQARCRPCPVPSRGPTTICPVAP